VKAVALGEVVDIVMGQAPPSEACNFNGIGKPFVKVGEFGPLRPVLREWTTKPLKIAHRSDVLLCVVGATCGKINLGEDCAIGRSVAAIRPKREILDQYYLYYFLSTLILILRSGSQGAAQTVISKEMIQAVELPLPPLPEQQRVVAILDEAFAGLATATTNAAKNLKNAKDLFDGYLNSTFGTKNEGWVDKSLDEVAIEFGRGKSRHRPRNDPSLYGGKYPFIQTGDIRNADHIIVEYSQTYNKKGLEQSKLWPKGTICITIAANIAETGILDFDACFPDSVIGMVVDPSQTNNKFVEYLLRFFKAVLQAQGKGSAQANINLATFESQKFPFPPVKIQNMLVGRLDALAKESRRLAASYQARLERIAELKQSILRKAFSGELISPPSRGIKEAAE
jgi:type I restriction enzyme S subunit